TLYANGVIAGSTANGPIPPSGRFAVAAQPQSLTTEFFAGALDEVRVFTFAPGAFSTSDLLLPVQPPYWRFGENDSGAAKGGPPTSTTNSSAGQMSLVGGPVYTNNAAAAASGIGSTLALRFASSQYGTNALVSTRADNFGIELWVKPDATNTTQCLAY